MLKSNKNTCCRSLKRLKYIPLDIIYIYSKKKTNFECNGIFFSFN